MTDPFIGTLFLALVGTLLAGLFLARLRMERERRRADAAENRSRSYLSIIEFLARTVREGAGTEQDWERLLEAARKQGLSESDLAAIGTRMGPVGAEPSSRPSPASNPVISDTRYLFVSFEEEIRRAAGQGRPLTLLTLEAEMGHTARLSSDPAVIDRILRGVAHAVRGQMRGCDTCIRFAAREFILILPGVSREEARQVEARIRTAAQAVTAEPRPGTVIHVRPALGSATYPEDGSSFDQLLTLANVRRSQDASADLPGGPQGRGPLSLPWQHSSVSPN